LVIVFGSVVAAVLPLAIGVFAIIGTLAILQILSGLTEVSIFALNLTTALGLGLAIDYALFVVSRYREELAAGFDPGDAVVRTVQTAGRTVIFSAATVAASLSAMLVFDLAFLRSFGYAGIAVVAMAAVGAVVVLPAMLAALGTRIDRWRLRKTRVVVDGEGVWHRIATGVMRRPVSVATVAIALLLFLGAPFLGVQLGTSDDRILGEGSYAREVGDVLRAEFGASESAPISIVSEATIGPDSLGDYAAELSTLTGVARVDALTGTYVGGQQVSPPTPLHQQFSGDGTYLSVVLGIDPISAEAEDLVADVRAVDAPVEMQVGGQSADFVDTKASLFSSLPWALAIIASITFVLLFLMFGSVVMPIKAIALNILSLSATFGALVWIFQDGNLSEFLGFTSTGSIDLTMPILIFVIAFGLSMDYEVFLLSRIKEEYDKTGDNIGSVAIGLERTGRIVTAAAVLIAVVFIAFATSEVLTIKMFGIGMTLAVLVDAFIVRATLVPAFMRLAGSVNWWAPAWMTTIYERFGISDHVELDDP
ncbi:MAG TPA: MMPL family transporter, partial [Actinobacteria bacterium]|nr:MMPL family transporter [Actinomycetota bacterium]